MGEKFLSLSGFMGCSSNMKKMQCLSDTFLLHCLCNMKWTWGIPSLNPQRTSKLYVQKYKYSCLQLSEGRFPRPSEPETKEAPRYSVKGFISILSWWVGPSIGSFTMRRIEPSKKNNLICTERPSAAFDWRHWSLDWLMEESQCSRPLMGVCANHSLGP